MDMQPRDTVVFDPAAHSAMDRQFMLSQLVVPRPIAMVVVGVQFDTSILNANGRIDPLALAPVGRLGLRSFVRTVPEGVLNLPRVPWEEHVAGTNGH